MSEEEQLDNLPPALVENVGASEYVSVTDQLARVHSVVADQLARVQWDVPDGVTLQSRVGYRPHNDFTASLVADSNENMVAVTIVMTDNEVILTRQAVDTDVPLVGNNEPPQLEQWRTPNPAPDGRQFTNTIGALEKPNVTTVGGAIGGGVGRGVWCAPPIDRHYW